MAVLALTAAQMAQLTSDIVWLVEQSVTLPDGSTERVLVPQLYVRVRPGDLNGSGALLSGERLRIETDPGRGDIVNTGTLAGRTLVSITEDNIYTSSSAQPDRLDSVYVTEPGAS